MSGAPSPVKHGEPDVLQALEQAISTSEAALNTAALVGHEVLRAAVARIKSAEAERDDADRRAGAAERRLEDAEDSISRRQQWLSRAKRERGYTDNTSFDRVWAETCRLADLARSAGAGE